MRRQTWEKKIQLAAGGGMQSARCLLVEGRRPCRYASISYAQPSAPCQGSPLCWACWGAWVWGTATHAATPGAPLHWAVWAGRPQPLLLLLLPVLTRCHPRALSGGGP